MPDRAPLPVGQFGPVVAGGRRRRPDRLNWRRIGLLAVAFVTLSAVTAGATGIALVMRGSRQIQRVQVGRLAVPGDTDGDGKSEIEEIDQVRNILLVGSDSRKGLSKREREELATGDFEGTRTDTLILLQLDPRRDAAAMLAFPRDLFVTRCDGSKGRINGAYEIGRTSDVGGPTCLVDTITELTGIPIHHYVQIDFQGFVDVVDTLGGVRMYLDEPIRDADADIDLPAGCVTLDGREALGFVRVRKVDNDFGRIARQQRFLREVVDKLTSARIALDIPRLFALVDAAANSLDVDPRLSLALMRRIAFSFRGLTSERIDARTVPAFDRSINGAAYLAVDEVSAEALFDAFRRGVAAPAGIGREGPKKVTVDDVPPVVVLNASTTTGLATAATAMLRSRGFDVTVTANADGRRRRTTVRYPAGQREEATLVARALGGARLAQGSGDAPLTVLLGRDRSREDMERRAAPGGPSQRPSPLAPSPAPTYAGADAERSC